MISDAMKALEPLFNETDICEAENIESSESKPSSDHENLINVHDYQIEETISDNY